MTRCEKCIRCKILKIPGVISVSGLCPHDEKNVFVDKDFYSDWRYFTVITENDLLIESKVE